MTSPQLVRGGRAGLSLLEVLVSLAIFLAALVGVGRLVIHGGELAADVRLQSEAAQLCQSKLAEVYAGAESLTPQHSAPFPQAPGFSWDLECEQDNTVPYLWRVQVRVSRPAGNGRPVEVTLSRWLLDPQARGSVFDLAAYDSANIDDSSSSGAGTGSGGTTGGNSSGGATSGGGSSTGSGAASGGK